MIISKFGMTLTHIQVLYSFDIEQTAYGINKFFSFLGCGWRKYTFDGQFLSSNIYVSYKAISHNLLASGIQIYYECMTF